MSDTSWLSELLRLRELRGNPSTRTLARSVGMSYSTIARVFTGDYLPPLRTLLGIAKALEGDKETFVDLWRLANQRAVSQFRMRADTERELLTDIRDELRAIRALLQRENR